MRRWILLILVVVACIAVDVRLSAQVVTARRWVDLVDARTIASNGGGTAATLTLSTNSSYVAITCNDPDGCAITLAETGVQNGQQLRVFNLSANAVTFADSAGVQELQSSVSLAQWSSLSCEYVTDRWSCGGSGGGAGTVTTTGSPASGNLAAFSGGSSITNTNLTGDVTTTGTVATTIAADAVSNTKLRNSGALSVIGRSANSTGDPADISATAATDAVLRESGSVLGFGTIATAGLANDAVTFAKMQNITAASRLMGRGSSSGSGDPEEIQLGSGLTMSGTTLSSSGGGGGGSSSNPGSLIFIEQQTPTGTSVTFSALGSYTNLRIIYSARGDQAATATAMTLRFNGDTGANYDLQQIDGAGSGTAGKAEVLAATSIALAEISAASSASGNVGLGSVTINDYRGTAFHKGGDAIISWKTSNAASGFEYRSRVFNWRSTAAITSITITLASGNFVTGSKFTLYGIASSAVSVSDPGQFNARLTTETGVPVSTTDRTSQSTLYLTPCRSGGNSCRSVSSAKIDLWDGSVTQRYSLTEISLALSGLTTASNYNIYVAAPGGICCTLYTGSIWTNDTTASETLATEDGYSVLSSDHQKRYVGVIRTTSTTTTEDSGGITGTTQVGGKRFVWNAYNQVARQLKVIDTTDTWSYTTDTIRQAGAAAGNKVEYVTGDAAMMVEAMVVSSVKTASNSTRDAKAGVGVDSTTTFSGLVGESFNSNASGVHTQIASPYEGTPGLGYHFLSWNEKGADVTCVFVGDDGATGVQSGLTARIWN